MTEKIKQIIGYYKESIDHFLCNDCFLKLNNLKKEDCNTITEDDLIKDVYICDACKKEIGINEKNYINNQQDEKFKKQEEIKEEKKPEIKSFKFYWLTPGTPKQIILERLDLSGKIY